MRAHPPIGHLDADCFYVSAERVRNRFLAEKAVGAISKETIQSYVDKVK